MAKYVAYQLTKKFREDLIQVITEKQKAHISADELMGVIYHGVVGQIGLHNDEEIQEKFKLICAYYKKPTEFVCNYITKYFGEEFKMPAIEQVHIDSIEDQHDVWILNNDYYTIGSKHIQIHYVPEILQYSII